MNTANLNVVNISAPELRVWQHIEDHWNRTLASSLGQYTVSTHWEALQTDGQQ